MEAQVFVSWLHDLAGQTGVTLQTLEDGTAFATSFYKTGRTQSVVIFPKGADDLGNELVAFFAPAIRLEGEDGRFYRHCLEANGESSHGAWAIRSINGTDTLGVMEVLPTECLTAKFFSSTVANLSAMADNLEQNLGQDDF